MSTQLCEAVAVTAQLGLACSLLKGHGFEVGLL